MVSRAIVIATSPLLGAQTDPGVGLTWASSPPISAELCQILEKWRETHLSAIEARPQAASRIPRAHVDAGRPESAGKAEG